MDYTNNLNSFIYSLKKNFEEFQSLAENNVHLNWEGEEAIYHSNDLEVS